MPSVEGSGAIRSNSVDTLRPTGADTPRSDFILPIHKAVSLPSRATLHHNRITVGTTITLHRDQDHAGTPLHIRRNRHFSQRRDPPSHRGQGRGLSPLKVPGPVSVRAVLSVIEAESTSRRGTVNGDHHAA